MQRCRIIWVSVAFLVVFSMFVTAQTPSEDGFRFPVNDENYPTITVTPGEDAIIEAEDALRVFGEGVAYAPEDVYQVNEDPDARNGKVVQFLLDDAGGRENDWDLYFPFELTADSKVSIMYRIRFQSYGIGESKAYVKMDDNEYDVWPEDFEGYTFEAPGAPFPPDDGGGWIQINQWSSLQRKDDPGGWGEGEDWKIIWCEGNWWNQTPDAEVLQWNLPAGEHVFKMTPRSRNGLELDYIVIVTDEFDRYPLDYEPPPYEPPAAVADFMVY